LATCHKAGHAKISKRKPTRSRFTLLRQLCNLIPNHLVPGLARQHDAGLAGRFARFERHDVVFRGLDPRLKAQDEVTPSGGF
jgi:hypothetical protein